jgi:hypothetical protein
MLERNFTLETDLFEVTTRKPGFINPRCFGEDFALWLVERLRARGFSPEEPIQEDWGWVLMLPHDGSRFTVSIGVMDDSIGCTPAEWSVGVSYEKDLNGVRAFFQPAPADKLAHLAGVLEATLRSEPRIHEVSPE